MTPEERRAIESLTQGPLRPPKSTPEEVLRSLGISDGAAWALRLLDQAERERDATDVEYAIIAGDVFGLPDDAIDLLVRLVHAPWHFDHEDVVWALGEMHSTKAIPALVHAATWVPEYLEFDDARALARKAVWGLGAIPGLEAAKALESLADSESTVIRDEVANQLKRRASA